MCRGLVRLSTNDVNKSCPVTDTKLIAEKLNMKHHSVTRLIRNYESDFKEFGELGFEIQGKEKKYVINEQQFTLLVTYFKNTDIVREYKKKFVKAFFLMKNELQARQETRHIGISVRKSLTDSIKNNVDEGTTFKKFSYSNYSKLVMKKVLGNTVKKIKLERGLKEKDNLRNFLSLEELEKVQELESKIASYIEMRKDLIGSDKEVYQEVKMYVDKIMQ